VEESRLEKQESGRACEAEEQVVVAPGVRWVPRRVLSRDVT
jgi:hypothetical protein